MDYTRSTVVQQIADLEEAFNSAQPGMKWAATRDEAAKIFAGTPIWVGKTNEGFKAKLIYIMRSAKKPFIFVISYPDGTEGVFTYLRDGTYTEGRKSDLDISSLPSILKTTRPPVPTMFQDPREEINPPDFIENLRENLTERHVEHSSLVLNLNIAKKIGDTVAIRELESKIETVVGAIRYISGSLRELK